MCVLFFCFFFQAEDGIRDLVRSRGLGDVYKRQVLGKRLQVQIQRTPDAQPGAQQVDIARRLGQVRAQVLEEVGPVSYTHLTLPTSDLV